MNSLPWFAAHLTRSRAEITYMCRHCGFLRFTNACALIYHVLIDKHEELQREYCVVCSQFFPNISDHLIKDPLDILTSRIKCPLCNFIAYSQCSYTLHSSYHFEELPYICPECNEYFICKLFLEKHMFESCYFNYKFKLFMCPCCFVMFSDQVTFNTHISIEHYERLLRCLICHSVFRSQQEFLSHRAEQHPESASTYHIIHNCELCPDFTYRGMSQQKHLLSHATDAKCAIFVYRCECNFFTLHKKKFTEHKKITTCQKLMKRSQMMKICTKCDDVRSYNFVEPFVCEACELLRNPTATKFYHCQVCQIVINFRWDAVLDHFHIYHKKVDLHMVPEHVMIFEPNKSDDVSPGQYIKSSSNFSGQSFSSSKDQLVPWRLFEISGVSMVSKSHSSKMANSGECSKLKNNFRKTNEQADNLLTKISVEKSCVINQPHKTEDPLVIDESESHETGEHSDCYNYDTDEQPENPDYNIGYMTTNYNNSSNFGRPKKSANPCDDIVEISDHADSSRDIRGLSKVDTGTESSDSSANYGLISIKTPASINASLLNGGQHFTEDETENESDINTNKSVEHNIDRETASRISPACTSNISGEKIILSCSVCKCIREVRRGMGNHNLKLQSSFQCGECSDIFESVSEKSYHLRTVHKLIDLEEEEEEIESSRSKINWKCTTCRNKSYTDQDKITHTGNHGIAFLNSLKPPT